MRWRLFCLAGFLGNKPEGRQPPNRSSSWHRVRTPRVLKAWAVREPRGARAARRPGRNGVFMSSSITGTTIDTPAKMKAMKRITNAADRSQRQYQLLRRRLAQLGYISQGSVQDRTARKGGGAGYQWTRKVAQKTITVSLTADQFVKMKEAVGNYRKLRQQLKQMETLSRSIIFQSAPHPGRRKRLSQKVLGIM